MKRSYSVIDMQKVKTMYPEGFPNWVDLEEWLAHGQNIMYIENESVGLLSWDYDGVYTGHWFFSVRGKEALNLAKRMLSRLFDTTNARVVRGITPVELKGARYLAKKLGFISLGIEEWDGPHEIMCLTKQAFKEANVG